MEKRCANCNAAFQCHTDGHCWCEELPRIPMPSDPSAGCLCHACLTEKIKLARANSVDPPQPV
jgi:hypothetical protein